MPVYWAVFRRDAAVTVPATLSPATIDAAAMGERADEASALLKALANPQRLRLLCLLVGRELSVGELNRDVELSQSALSQHLSRLRAEGLVSTRRAAQTIYYRLEPGPAQQVIGVLHDCYCQPRTAAAKRRGRKR